MEDKSVHDLLEQAGAEYNRGQYARAIALWEEVLRQDPENQKAHEGIRMAKLLVVNWESSQAGGEEELSLEGGGVDPETRQKIEFGVRRVRELLGSGRHREAVEGCQLLAELAPDMPEVKQLQEEIAHAVEAKPFVDEHLGRARKLLAAQKVAEALEEARKVISVDPGNEEARTILARASGAADEGTAPPPASAFQSGASQAPPSPFAGSATADDLAAGMDLERMRKEGEEAAAPAQDAPGEEMSLEMGFQEVAEPAPAGEEPGAPAGGEDVSQIIAEGRRLYEQKRYQDAIDAWSRIYAIDQSNTQVSDLIDQAKARLSEIGAQVEEAMYRAQDQVDSGNLSGAKKAFEEVLALQPGNREALHQIAKIEETLGSKEEAGGEEDLGEALPLAEPDPPVAPGAGEAQTGTASEPPSVGLAREPHATSRDGGATRPVRQPPMPVSAGLPKRKPVQPIKPPSQAPRMILVGALGAAVLAAGAAGWWFLMGPGAEPPPTLDPAPQAAAEPLPEPSAAPGQGPGTGDGGSEVQNAGGGVAGAGTEQAAPAAPASPADIERRVRSLMREGRVLLERGDYAGAQARFAEVLTLEPTNFDAEDLRMKASTLLAKQQKFDRDLESAIQAFQDQDWGSSLYKLYRLQMEREDMEILSRYIKNANYNWGIQSMEAFQTSDAIQHFGDALEQDPGDRSIEQHVEVARRYERRRRDSAYDAYVERLQLRAIDAR